MIKAISRRAAVITGTTALVSCEIYLPLGMYEAVINDFEFLGTLERDGTVHVRFQELD